MNRIRYAKTEKPNIFSSVKVFKTSDGKEVRVFLNDITKAYGILDLSNDQILLSGVTSHMNKTKICAKEALETLGVTFNKEVRNNEQTETESAGTSSGNNSSGADSGSLS
jgi:hypothetical protein